MLLDNIEILSTRASGYLYHRIQILITILPFYLFLLIVVLVSVQVKQSSRGVKSAYKDLKTKLSDRTPPKGCTTSRGSASAMPSTTASMHQHYSAPNSPVFTKRSHTELFTNNSNSSQHQRKPSSSHTMLQTSNSMMNNSSTANLINHKNINNNHNQNNNNNNNNNHNNTSSNSYSCSSNSNNHINILRTNNKTPTRITPSPTSSNSSSEMNLLQELQQHALFKSPAVDRSVSVDVCVGVVAFGLAAKIQLTYGLANCTYMYLHLQLSHAPLHHYTISMNK